MKYKRYAGHNGKRRKITRLVKHLTGVYNNEHRYSAMEEVAERIYKLMLLMPYDDIVRDKPLKEVSEMMRRMEQYEDRQYAISLTY